MTEPTAEHTLGEAGIGPANRSLVLEASAAARDAFDSALRGFEAQVARPLRELVAAGARRHGNMAGEGVSASRVAAYRTVVCEEVLGPLAEQLANLPRELAIDAIIRIPEVLAPLAEHAAEQLTMPPVAAAASKNGQDRNTGSGHALRRLRPVGRRRKDAQSEDHRIVPFRALLRYHFRVRVARSAERLHSHAERHVASMAGRLEAAMSKWSDALLRIEHELEGDVAPEVPLEAHPERSLVDEEYRAAPEMAEELRAAANGLQQVLEDVAAGSMPEFDSAAALDQDLLQLAEDLRHAGTASLKESDRRLPEEFAAHRMRELRKRWSSWHEQARARMDLVIRMLRLRQAVVEARGAATTQVRRAALAPVLQAFGDAATQLEDASRSCSAEEPDSLPAALQHLEDAALEPVRHSLTGLPGTLAADQVLALAGRDQWQALTSQVQDWPDAFVTHPTPQPESPIVPGAGIERRHVKRDVLQVLAPFSERLAPSAERLRGRLRDIWQAAEQVLSVAEFSLAAARKELEGGNGQQRAEDARQLASGGLLRAADTLRDLLQSLQAPWQQFAQAVHELFRQDWADIHRSVRAEASIEHWWLGLRKRLGRGRQQAGVRLRARVAGIRSALGQVLRRGHRRAADLIEQGRTAIGVTGAAESARLATLEAISQDALRALQEQLPLVYRKLFALEPVSEPWLLEGRDDDLAYLRQHVHRGQSNVTAGALLLPMPAGSGRTSLLRILAMELEETNSTHTVTLQRRVHHAAELAHALAGAMGISAHSLEELERRLLQSRPAVCLIDNLEHLMLRTYGGTALLERALLFFARTASRVCWIGTISNLAWQYLERVLGSASSLVSTYRPAVASRSMLGSIMLGRHNRSGLRLVFAPGAALTPIFYRKLERARDEEARQALLRDHCIERLYHQCGSNIALGLFYWLRSAAFDRGRVTLQAPAPLSFRFLETLGLARAFTLKAFLMHNTLTLSEHEAIFHAPEDESASSLQSLLKLNLIVPCESQPASPGGAPGRIADSARFRLHPLVVHPVEQWLRGQNIIH